MSKQTTMVVLIGLGGLLVYKVFVADKATPTNAQTSGVTNPTGGVNTAGNPDLFTSIVNTANSLFGAVQSIARSAPANT